MSRDDEGSAVLETVIVAPIVLLILAVIIAAGRLVLAHQRVDAVANEAARAASLAASPSAAAAAAQDAADDAVRAQDLDCSSVHVDVDTSDFRPSGAVRTTVTCMADLGVGVPGLAGKQTLHATSSQVIERFRDVAP